MQNKKKATAVPLSSCSFTHQFIYTLMKPSSTLRSLFSLFAAIVLLASCAPRETKVVIFATNDMHARIHNFAKIKSIVDAERAANPCVLLLCGGDKYTGNTDVDQYPEKGYPIVDLMNRVGYDYETFGNHEFDYGQEALAARRGQALFPALAANIHVDSTALITQPDPYVLVTLPVPGLHARLWPPAIGSNGIRVALLGLAQCSPHDDGTWSPRAHPDRLRGVTFSDPIATAQQYRHLRSDCDLFVALTHIGYDQDTLLAHAMPELDVIVGGHSHTRIDSTLVVDGVLVTQTESWLKYLGKTTVTLRGHKVVDKQFELIDLSADLPEDAEVKACHDEYAASSPLDEAIATFPQQFSGHEAISTFLTDALRAELDCDIAFQNSGGIRIGEMKAGPVTKRDIYAVDPFGNTMLVYALTPAQLRDLLAGSYQTASKRADLLPSGLCYTLHTHDGHLTAITMTDMDGRPLDENRTYRVGMNSYVAASYAFDHSNLVLTTAETSEDLIIRHLQSVGTATPQPRRTFVVEE